MAWGSFAKKLKGFGEGLVRGARKVLDKVKPIVDFVTPYVPGGKVVKDVVDVVDDWVPKNKSMSGPPQGYGQGDRIKKGGELPSDVRQWLNSQIRA